MKFFRLFFVLVFSFMFISCFPERDENYVNRHKKKGQDSYEGLLVLHLYKTIEEYRNTVATLEEERVVYEDMMEIYYSINNIHNEIIKEREISAHVLQKLKDQVTALEELMTNVNWPAEVHKKLQAIKAEIDQIQKDLEMISEGKADPEEVSAEGGEVIPADSAGADSAEGGMPVVEESDPYPIKRADGSVVEESAVEGEATDGSVVEEPAVEEEVTAEQVVEEPAVEGEATDGSVVEEPAVEGEVTDGSVVEEPAVEEEVTADQVVEEPAVEGEAEQKANPVINIEVTNTLIEE